MILNTRVNGRAVAWEVAPEERLLDVLRRHGILGPKRGCGTGSCGACTVLVDGRAVASCILFAGQVEGREVTTVEGLGDPAHPHPIQAAFVDHAAVQCGFCTPGMVVATYGLLSEVPDPTEDEIREALDGNLCRCTGYKKIVEAVQDAATRMGKAGGR